VNKIKQNNLYF